MIIIGNTCLKQICFSYKIKLEYKFSKEGYTSVKFSFLLVQDLKQNISENDPSALLAAIY